MFRRRLTRHFLGSAGTVLSCSTGDMPETSNGNARVAIVHTIEKHRSLQRVLPLVREAIDLVGGVARFIKPGSNVLIKPNQAGTLTETRAALRAGKDAGFGTIVSARSGETEDVSIVHLAVGWNAGQLKVGSFTRSAKLAGLAARCAR